MANYGGVILFKLPDGSNLKVRGSVTHNPAPMSAEAVVNHDLSVDRQFTPQGYRFAMSLANRDANGAPVDVAGLMLQEKVTFTFMHASEGYDRTYSRAALVGDPSVDDLTGEISGLTGIAEGFLEVAR